MTGSRPGSARARAQSLSICAISSLDRVETAVAADEVHELDLDLAAVEVAVEVEQEDLENRRAVVEGRPGAEIGGASCCAPSICTRTA